MAEMAVSFAIDQLLPLLREEAGLLKDIHNEFANVKDELEIIQASLKDADRRAAAEEDNNIGVKRWVKQLREATFRIEDIIDDYMIYMEQQPRDLGCLALLHKIAHLLKTLKDRHQIASEIQAIKLFVREIKAKSHTYEFQILPSNEQESRSFRESQNVKWHDPRTAALYIDEAEIVGFQAPKNQLIGWLVEGRSERTVISVVGMGGQGKTTLAKKVFDSKEVAGHFECRVWITVSKSYYTEGLLRDMLNGLYKQKGVDHSQDISKMDQGSLISELRNYLQQKRYVFMFDDVWNIHFWDEIENALIDNKNGSKIFITTRIKDVAKYCKKSSFIEVHELQPLSEEQSFELFNKKAFRFDFDGCCPKELMDISFQIARKCKGLPLAIVAIGGLLSTKEKNVLEWQRFCKNMTSELLKDPHLTGINKILGFSYDDLHFHLKSCLLYFGMYPEDYEVKSKRLIRQWIAEGFVKEESGYTLEEVAEGYLTELIHRSLVQVSSVRFDGKTKKCCVHDLIRLMILEKCEDLSFCRQISEDDHLSSFGIIRRLAITTHSNDFTTCTENSHVRSLFLFPNQSQFLDEHFARRIFTEYKRLKVINMVAKFSYIKENIGSLIHLKYLSFNKEGFLEFQEPEFVESIGMLENLETLDIRGTSIYMIPKEIRKLRKLRHLLGRGMSLLELKGGIGGMECLETLSKAWIRENEIELIKELEKLRKLRKLGLEGIKEHHGSAISSLLNETRHLEKLKIRSKMPRRSSYAKVIDVHLASPPPMLRILKLNGTLDEFPKWIPKLQNLVKLKLVNSRLVDDPINYLENMSNLLSLSILDNAYEGESLHFHDGGFQNLKELFITKLPNLHLIVIDKGALHSLKKFELSGIPNLETGPAGIQYLENLEVLNFCVPNEEIHPKL